MKKFEIPEGHEIRGEVIRIYPTREQEARLAALQASLKTCWNWFCKQTQEVIDARCAYAVRQGLVGPRPVRPDYDNMEPSKAKKAAEAHRSACAEWHRRVYEQTNKLECCEWRPKMKEMIALYSCDGRSMRHDYQLLREVVLGNLDEPPTVAPSAHLLQALVHNYFSGKAKDGKGRAKGQQRKKFRRRDDDMRLVVRSGECLRIGNFTPEYTKPGQHQSYNCQISFEGMKFLGKLPGRKPTGRVLDGVAIRQEADGWYASIKQVVPVRQLPTAIPGTVVGVSMGLDVMAATSDGRIIDNPRGHELARKIRELQSLESITKPGAADKTTVGRLHQKARRIAKHMLHNELLKPLATVEVIKVEDSSQNVGFLPHEWDGKASQQRSVMRLGPKMLLERYGSRVREVECRDNTVTCSQCGKTNKIWGIYVPDPMLKCDGCGLVIHRRINAARNVAAKPTELQDAAK